MGILESNFYELPFDEGSIACASELNISIDEDDEDVHACVSNYDKSLTLDVYMSKSSNLRDTISVSIFLSGANIEYCYRCPEQKDFRIAFKHDANYLKELVFCALNSEFETRIGDMFMAHKLFIFYALAKVADESEAIHEKLLSKFGSKF